jgi:septum formation protein
VVVPAVEELSVGAPEEVVLENAHRKAAAGSVLAGPEALVLGVDTDVALDGRLLGKPSDEAGARQRLERLSGRTHQVLSGLWLTGTDGDRGGVARTEVRFHDLDPAVVELYLRSGEWRDRAGAYAIQGLGSVLVAGLQGDFANVVGLPIALLLQLAPNLME